MKTQYYTATSLDGFIATEDDSLEWLFTLGDVNDTSYPAFIEQVGALAMGSATYEWMLRNADKVAADTGSAWPYSQPTWIFSTRELPSIAGANTRFVQGDVRPVHAEMTRRRAPRTSGLSAAEILRGNSSTLACSTKCSFRSVRSPWEGASRCSRGASRPRRFVCFRLDRSARVSRSCTTRCVVLSFDPEIPWFACPSLHFRRVAR